MEYFAVHPILSLPYQIRKTFLRFVFEHINNQLYARILLYNVCVKYIVKSSFYYLFKNLWNVQDQHLAIHKLPDNEIKFMIYDIANKINVIILVFVF